MKTFYLIALMVVTAGTAAHAQSNTNATPQPLRLTDVYSDSADLDWVARTGTFRGHVRVINPDLKLTCERLVADVLGTGRINHVVAETNVVIDVKDSKDQAMEATGDKAVYVYEVQNGATNDTVTLTGNPLVRDAHGTQAGDSIVWDRVNNIFHFTNPHMVFTNAFNDVPAGTNNLTAPKKQLPPGTTENIDGTGGVGGPRF
jgi:lipopolysaccharide transport protein LptA